MEDRTCKTCKDNDNGLCDRKGIWVTDDHTCSKWRPEWRKQLLTKFLKVK